MAAEKSRSYNTLFLLLHLLAPVPNVGTDEEIPFPHEMAERQERCTKTRKKPVVKDEAEKKRESGKRRIGRKKILMYLCLICAV